MAPITSWGRLSRHDHDIVDLSSPTNVRSEVQSRPFPGITYGMGRSYGDVCLNPGGTLWRTTQLNGFESFDRSLGRIRCEAGVLLRDIQQIAVASGWMLPVSPGTQLVTVGGAIANDVHGKSHHVHGTFGDHVLHLKLQRTDGQLIECSPQANEDWFRATIGGMGLTGIITSAEIQLRKVAGPWIEKESIAFGNLDEFFSIADESESQWENTVAWIDCVSGAGDKGIFIRGNPSGKPLDNSSKRSDTASNTGIAFPFVPPISLVNRLTLRPFNFAYFNAQKLLAGRQLRPANTPNSDDEARSVGNVHAGGNLHSVDEVHATKRHVIGKNTSTVHYEPFFYQLDKLKDWNKMYGPKGFFQYQSVIPPAAREQATKEMLSEISKSGTGSFLAVLKTFGNKPPAGMMSFPFEGVTLALDFPNAGPKSMKLFERLDAIVRQAQGRLYMAKDSRMPRDMFESGYSHLEEFLKFRDPGISSALSRRLIGS